jgi:hypothetical protein
MSKPMAPRRNIRPVRPEPSPEAKRVAALLRRAVAAELGPDSTFEQRRDASARLMGQALAAAAAEMADEAVDVDAGAGPKEEV